MMRKVFFVLFVLSVMAVGFFLGTMSNNKAYALLTPGPGGTVECLQATTGQPCEPAKASYEELLEANHLLLKENYNLRQELEIYQALEAFWSTEALGTKQRTASFDCPTGTSWCYRSSGITKIEID